MSVRVLAIDTTGEAGSLALAEGDRVIEEITLRSDDGFAHVIFVEIERMLARHKWTLRDVDCFASASGPGSFTGVRVGLTAVKGLSEATGRKVVAVSNLQALAWHGTRALRATVIDARRGEVYGAVYNAALECIEDEVVGLLAAWIESLPAGDLQIVTNAVAIDCGAVYVPVAHAPAALAGAIALIGSREFEAGRARTPEEIDANYVRRSDAELLWKDPAAR